MTPFLLFGISTNCLCDKLTYYFSFFMFLFLFFIFHTRDFIDEKKANNSVKVISELYMYYRYATKEIVRQTIGTTVTLGNDNRTTTAGSWISVNLERTIKLTTWHWNAWHGSRDIYFTLLQINGQIILLCHRILQFIIRLHRFLLDNINIFKKLKLK